MECKNQTLLKISYVIEQISEFAGKLGAFTAVISAILIVYDASMRYIFHEGSIALQEMEWHLFDILFLLGLSYALKHNKHVRVDILYERFPKRIKIFIHIISMLFFVIPIGVLIVWFSWDFTIQSLLQHEGSPNPGGLCCRYIIKFFILIAFSLLVLQATSEIIKALYRLGEKK